jgi:hypothetical protein
VGENVQAPVSEDMTINHAHLLMHTRPLVKRNPKLNQTALHTILMLKQQLRLLVLWPCIHVNGDIA